MARTVIKGDQIKGDTITEDEIADEAIKHFVFGSADLNSNGKPVNWVNSASVSSAIGIKTWFIVPFTCKIDRIIVTVKGNSFNTATDGQFSVKAYKNQPNFNSTVVDQTIGCDDFIQLVSNMAGGTVDCNQRAFVSLNVDLNEGDLLQVKVNKTAGSEREALVTVVFT